jgi:hypothetical protein
MKSPKKHHLPLARIMSDKLALLWLFIIGIGLIAGLECYQNYYFTNDDNAIQHLPWLIHNYRSLSHYGEFAFVNFHQYAGHAHYLAGQSQVFYWPIYISVGWLINYGAISGRA